MSGESLIFTRFGIDTRRSDGVAEMLHRLPPPRRRLGFRLRIRGSVVLRVEYILADEKTDMRKKKRME